MAEKVKVKGWPISQRGEDMEQARKQQQAADLMNLQKLAIIRQRRGC